MSEHVILPLEFLEMTMVQTIKDASQKMEDNLRDELCRLIETVTTCKGIKIEEGINVINSFLMKENNHEQAKS